MPHASPFHGMASPPIKSRDLAVQPSSPPTPLNTFLPLGVLSSIVQSRTHDF
jgi:hypothetical protein